MNKPDADSEITDINTARLRISELEEKFSWAISALDLVGTLTQFQTVVNQGENVDMVLSETRNRIEQIIPLRASAFLMVNPEDASFTLTQCFPPAAASEIQNEVDALTKSGMFAWAVQQNRAVTNNINQNRETLFLHSMTTPKRAIGMFIGISDIGPEKVTDISLRMLTMILTSAASAIESHALHKIVQNHNENLENMVKMRTQQLETAREESEQANRAKSVFLANMSHELRTPLNAVLGYAEIISEDAKEANNDDLVDDLGKIFSAGSHLLALINDLLDLSKIEAGRMELEWNSFSIDELVNHIKVIAPPLAEKRNNDLIIENTSTVSNFYVDSLRLRQAITNLISNACKFTRDGEISITISDGPQEKGSNINFTVTDSGIGIHPNKAKLIFDAFAQAEASTTREFGGTGLGLTITKKLCQMMGGDVSVESDPDKGSTFTISLPNFQNAPGSSMTLDEPHPSRNK